MAYTKYLPTLSPDGWATTPEKKVDYLMAHFFTSDYSQSYEFFGKVRSLAWILQKTNGNPTETCVAIREDLTYYFSSYFNNVIVETTESNDILKPNQYSISIFAQFEDDQGKTYNLGRIVRYTGTIIDTILNTING